MRRPPLLFAAAAVGLCLNGVSAASCIGPSLTVTPSSTKASAVVTVEADGLYDGGCDDTGGGGSCSRQDRGPSPREVVQGSTVKLSVNGRLYPLGELEPSNNGYRRGRLTLPAAIPAGAWELQVVSRDGVVRATAPLTISPPGR